MNNPALKTIKILHSSLIFSNRTDILASELANRLPRDAVVLDVGCGDGTIDTKLLKLRPDLTITGIDTFVRPNSAIKVVAFDGQKIPFPDQSFDYVLIVDVLHHTTDPEVLVAEAKRVTKTGIIVKDHLANSPLDHFLLRIMDWVGNRPYDVKLVYNYWSKAQWLNLWKKLDLKLEGQPKKVKLYPFPISLFLPSSLQFLSEVKRRR